MRYVYRYIPPKCFTERWFSLITWTQKMLDTTLEIFDVGNIKRMVAVKVLKQHYKVVAGDLMKLVNFMTLWLELSLSFL